MRHLFVVVFLFVPVVLLAQLFPVQTVENLLADQHYETACRLIDDYNKAYPNQVLPVNHYFQGKAYSQLYFQKAATLAANENAAYFQLINFLDRSFEGFSKVLQGSNDEFKEPSLRQLKGIIVFLKQVSLTYYKQGNMERFYFNIQNARKCNELIKQSTSGNKITQLDIDLTFHAIYGAEINGQVETAKMLFLELNKMGISQPQMYSSFSKMYLELEELSMAIEMIKKGRDKFPKMSNLLFQELDLYFQSNQFDRVISTVDKALPDFQGESAQLYFIKGNAFDQAYSILAKKEKKKANKYYLQAEIAYSKAVELSPQTFDFVFNLATLYYNKALLIAEEASEKEIARHRILFAKAEKALQNTLALDGSRKKVRSALADIYKWMD